MSIFRMTYGLATTKGQARDINQDSVIALTWSDVPQFSGQDVGLFIVADGMGKGDTGLNASRLAVEMVAEAVKNAIAQSNELNISQLMTEAFQEANQRVITDNPDGATTLTAALLIDNQIHIAHVGDSRLYCIRDNTITLMTNDHSLISRFFGTTEFTPDDYEEPPLRRLVTRVLGQSETLEVDFRSEQIAPKSQLLLCTDGLIASDSQLTEADILPVVLNNEPHEACHQLTELAQKHGSTDDVTVIVVKLSDE